MKKIITVFFMLVFLCGYSLLAEENGTISDDVNEYVGTLGKVSLYGSIIDTVFIEKAINTKTNFTYLR